VQLLQDILSNNKLAITRTLTLIENEDVNAQKISQQLFKYTGNAYRIGITGLPGVGKSTLICELALLLSKHNKKVAIIAIDPSSPFSGGALLGDRIRMNKLSQQNIFIRSMATRGATGGIAKTTFEVADVLDASGKTVILIETVGAGQSEVEIANGVDLVCVVTSPDAGDFVQAMKAGIMEIADIIVINKADKPGAERMEWEIKTVFELFPKKSSIPIVKTEAQNAKGIDNLLQIINNLLEDMKNNGQLKMRRHKGVQYRLKKTIDSMLYRDVWLDEKIQRLLETCTSKVLNGEVSIYEAAKQIIKILRR
jgi:LAO/AO transport system kinase